MPESHIIGYCPFLVMAMMFPCRSYEVFHYSGTDCINAFFY